MRIITSEIERYFQSLQTRLAEARLVSFENVSLADWQPKPSDCHNNVDYWTTRHVGCTRVRGWLTWGEDESGSCHFIAHSVVEQDGALYDITPIDPNTPPPRFVKHLGETEVFDAMQPAWSWTIYPFITELPLEPTVPDEDIDQFD